MKTAMVMAVAGTLIAAAGVAAAGDVGLEGLQKAEASARRLVRAGASTAAFDGRAADECATTGKLVTTETACCSHKAVPDRTSFLRCVDVSAPCVDSCPPNVRPPFPYYRNPRL